MVRAKGNGQRAFDVKAGQVPAEWISHDLDAVSQLLEDARFFPNANVRAVVEEEGGRGDHEHAVRHGC